MIVSQDIVVDFLAHSVVLLLIGAYVRFITRTRASTYVLASVVAAAIITYVNHRYFPKLLLSRFI